MDEMRESESCVVRLREREGGESQVKRREKKLLKIKYTCYSACVNLHGYYSSLKILDDFTHF